MKVSEQKRLNLLLLKYFEQTKKRNEVIALNPPYVHSVRLTERQYNRLKRINKKRLDLLQRLIALDKIRCE